MVRWVRHALLVALALSLGMVLGDGDGRAQSKPVPIALAIGSPQEAVLFSYSAGRAHPEGPDADDQPTRSRPPYPALASGLWTGGRRHPQWRGCQHVYDPKLGKLIFSSSPGAEKPDL
jgi:hypothetical protein